MQGPVVYSNLPPTQQTRRPVPGHVLNRLVYFILPIVLVVLVGASMFWLQWASQRGIALGYPTPHVAIFTSVNNNTVQVRNAIQFTADASGRGLTYVWDFGDNTSGTGLAVSHSYQRGGAYTVTVTATDVINQSSTTRQTVTVTVPPPQASFTSNNSYGYGYVYFDASSSIADPSTYIQSYNWDFGDGNTYQTSNPQYDYQYANYGQQYTVTLTVTDGTGQTSSSSVQTINT